MIGIEKNQEERGQATKESIKVGRQLLPSENIASGLVKRLTIYLVVTFGLTWGLLIPAGFLLGRIDAPHVREAAFTRCYTAAEELFG